MANALFSTASWAAKPTLYTPPSFLGALPRPLVVDPPRQMAARMGYPSVHGIADGYLLQLTAVDKFCFIATHLNIVTSAPAGM